MLTRKQIEDAQERLQNRIHRTPMLSSQTLNDKVGASIFIKAEHLQKTGSFKIRGAMNRVLKAKESGANHVVAASSGNHGQAVAYAARSLGLAATIVVPETVIAAKEKAIKAYGGIVIQCGTTSEERLDYAQQVVKEITGATYIPPYDDYELMAGQGTVGLEILAQVKQAEVVVVPVGGGGLMSGVATAIKSMYPAIQVIGVEPDEANDTEQSIKAGKRLSIPAAQTIADGLRASVPGELTFPILQSNVERLLRVSDEAIREACQFYLARMKQVVEPSGAVTLAALLAGKIDHQGGTVVLVASGGNVDLESIGQLV
ncbi:LOW QUALITY PROTEIN: threonine dehydratase, catabolic [Bacillus sp. JCM 19045]|nr:LOW QUALITY PROTEIN: threonine dehydratase, catabolic [Bacillus sp. JCM 19045]